MSDWKKNLKNSVKNGNLDVKFGQLNGYISKFLFIFILGDAMSAEYLLKEIQDLELLHLAADRGKVISEKKTETFLSKCCLMRVDC